MATNKQLQQQIDRLEGIVARLSGRSITSPAASRPMRPEDRPDYIAQGSEKHAIFLGLIKAPEGETLECDGYTLLDSTLFGPNVTEKFLARILAQKVNELNTPIPVPQSKDPTKPHFAPTLWREGMSLAKITED